MSAGVWDGSTLDLTISVFTRLYLGRCVWKKTISHVCTFPCKHWLQSSNYWSLFHYSNGDFIKLIRFMNNNLSAILHHKHLAETREKEQTILNVAAVKSSSAHYDEKVIGLTRIFTLKQILQLNEQIREQELEYSNNTSQIMNKQSFYS